MNKKDLIQSKKKVKEEIATPSRTRAVIGSHSTRGLNPERLSNLLQNADNGDIDAFLNLAEELEEKEPHYLSVIGTRKRAVAQLDITVSAASEEASDVAHAAFIEDWLARDAIEDELFDILDAIGKGYSVTEIMWDISGDAWLPKSLDYKSPSWFQIDKDDGKTIRLKDGSAMGQDLPENKFIIHRHKAKSGLVARGGVARPCAFMWLFKNFSLKDWVIFTEAYGQPMRLGKFHAGASEEDQETLLRAVSRIGSDSSAIIPDGMMIELLEAGSKASSADVFEKLCRYCDQQISKAVLGQTTTTDAISGGHAVSKEHNEVRHDIERSDAKQLAATLNEQLIRPIIDFNFGPQQRYPRLYIGRSEDIDMDKQSTIAQRAVEMGVPLSKKGVREMFGLPAPEDDADAALGKNTLPPQQAQALRGAAFSKQGQDQIDDLSQDFAENYEELMEGTVTTLEEIARESSSYEEFQDKLLSVADRLDLEKAAEYVAQGSFFARAAGNFEIDPDDR